MSRSPPQPSISPIRLPCPPPRRRHHHHRPTIPPPHHPTPPQAVMISDVQAYLLLPQVAGIVIACLAMLPLTGLSRHHFWNEFFGTILLVRAAPLNTYTPPVSPAPTRLPCPPAMVLVDCAVGQCTLVLMRQYRSWECALQPKRRTANAREQLRRGAVDRPTIF